MELEPAAAPRRIVLTTVIFEGSLAVLAFVLAALLGYNLLELIQWTSAGLVQGLIGTLPLLAVLILATKYPLGPLRELSQVVSEIIVPLFRNCSIGELLLISALAGLGEELLFRGLLQHWLAQSTGSDWLAIVLASVVFGLAHPVTRTYVVVAGLIGVYLGWLWLASGNLLAPIVTHGVYDFVALVYLVRGRARSGQPAEQSSEISSPPATLE